MRDRKAIEDDCVVRPSIFVGDDSSPFAQPLLAILQQQELALEVALDLRDQNERIIELLQNQHVQMRAVALQAIVDVNRQAAYGDEPA